LDKLDFGEQLAILKERRGSLPEPVRQQVEEKLCCLADPALDCGDCIGIFAALLEISRTHRAALGLSP